MAWYLVMHRDNFTLPYNIFTSIFTQKYRVILYLYMMKNVKKKKKIQYNTITSEKTDIWQLWSVLKLVYPHSG
jgi:hypothetical protein